MNTDMAHLVEQFADLRVLVIGDAMLDVYERGEVERLAQEAPVPIVRMTGKEFVPGGAANTAANVAGLGAATVLLSVVGEDMEGARLREGLTRLDVNTDHVLTSPTRHTLVKRRIASSSQMLVRVDEGDTDPVSAEMTDRLIEQLRALYPLSDAVIVSDYAYGILTPAVIESIGDCQARFPRVLVVDSKNLLAYRNVGMTVAKPNYEEALRLEAQSDGRDASDHPVRNRLAWVRAHGYRIQRTLRAQVLAITLDQDGALVFNGTDLPYRTYATPVPNSQAAGAGDTFIGGIALALAAGTNLHAAAELASAAAEIVARRDGTSVCSADELRLRLGTNEKHIPDLELLRMQVAHYRRQGRRIVFTNGCFDILHRGHIVYLNQAKQLGDVLIVGVNSDAGVAKLKGPTRPVNKLEDRVQVLAGLSSVDHTIAFDEDTPVDLIRAIQPDVFVKGGDYTRATLPEAPVVEGLGGKVVILPYLEDVSTSRIIDRIRERSRATAGSHLTSAAGGGR